MLKRVYFGLILLTTIFADGQVCKHLSLSKKFEFEIGFARIPHKKEMGDSCVISLKIINKKSKEIQKIKIYSEFIFSSDFKDCKSVRSFSTGINKNIPVYDNCSGDFIVIDLNFDGLEDFAIISDSGGNGGPTYNFYIQDKNGKFSKDSYLTKTMEFFPQQINKSKKRLTIYVHASAYDLSKTIFEYNPKYKKWKVVNNTLVKDSPNRIEIK